METGKGTEKSLKDILYHIFLFHFACFTSLETNWKFNLRQLSAADVFAHGRGLLAFHDRFQ